MKTARIAAACIAVLALALPSAAQADFGPTEPLTENPPTTPFAPVFATKGANGKLKMFGPNGAQAEAATPGLNIDTNNIHVSFNARGDSLVTWTENGGATHVMYAVFWPAGAGAPNPVHELLTGGSVTANRPWSVLDPDGSATAVWNQAGKLYQVTTQDAGGADPWGAPTELGAGGASLASLPDGRAVGGIVEQVQTTAGPIPRFWRSHVTTRTEGQPFQPPQTLSGGDPANPPSRFVAESVAVVAIDPAGRALVGYITTLNGDNGACDPYEREIHAALGQVNGSAPSFTDQVVNDGAAADPNVSIFGARAGTDDRLALAWQESVGGCHADVNRPQRYVAAYTAPGQTTMTPTGPGIPAPGTLTNFWFRPNGDLLFATSHSSAPTNRQTVFAIGVPVADPGTQNPPPTGGGGGTPPATPPTTPGGTGGGGGGGGTTTIVPVVPGKFSATSSGVVRTSVNVPGPGDLGMDLVVKASGLVRKSAAKTVKVASFKKKVTKAGKVAVSLKLSARAKKTLKKKGKLKVTVTTTFKPTGGKVVKKTTTVVLKSKR